MTKTLSAVTDGERKPGRRAQRPAAAPAASPSAMPDSLHPIKAKAPAKAHLLVALLRRPEGVTAAQMSEASGWQVHTVRGFIAGAVKKKLGLTVTAEKIDGQTVYRITGEAAA